MPAATAFRISLYLSLALATLAMGVAGGDLLPELPFVTGFSLLVLAATYFIEGRWQLSLRDANLVGIGLAVVLGLWAIFQIVRPPTGLSDILPWPASALPYLAPVLMILMPAKMLRPKHVGDYWTMHGLGLLAMALACAMAMDGVFVLLFIVYTVIFVWSLIAFQTYRELGQQYAGRRISNDRWHGMRVAILSAVVCGGAAVPLFWATPRSGAEWELAINTRGHSMTGLSDGSVDLNKTGTVDVNSEKAFEFFAATPDGQPVLDLPTDLRFRSMHRHNYESGRWIRNYQIGALNQDHVSNPPALVRDPLNKMLDLGPGTIYLSFTIQPRLSRTPPIADPVDWRPGQLAPLYGRQDEAGYRPWSQKPDGTFDAAINSDARAPQYLQSWRFPDTFGDGPIIRINPATNGHLSTLVGLGDLTTYTNRLIERLVAEGQLSQAVLFDVDGVQNRKPQHHEAIARALEHYLATSPEFKYSLDLTRQNKTIDPTVDFLLNTKSGHCQRFATALALMLRSQGIPCQLVLGYHGCTNRGDGWYEVHEDQAHAWVEALLPSKVIRPRGVLWDQASSDRGVLWLLSMAGGGVVKPLTLRDELKPYRWVTLDPTPGVPDGDASNSGNLLEQARQKWESLLKVLLLAYNRDSRDQAAEALGNWFVDEYGWAYVSTVVAIVALLVVWRRRACRRRAMFAGFPNFVRRLAMALSRAGYTWSAGQTAREFAEAAGIQLAANLATSSISAIPGKVIAVYYAERFGKRGPTENDIRTIESDLKRLEVALV